MPPAEPIELHYLTLHPHPLSALPTVSDSPSSPFAAFTSALASESSAILNHPGWHSPKDWFGGVVTTHSLPDDAVRMRPLHGSEELKVAQVAPPKRKRGFWGGGDATAETKEDEGIHWHRRVTRLSGARADFEALWAALGVRHSEQEELYVPTLDRVIPVVDSVVMKLYNLPFPTTNRSFLSFVTVIRPSPDTFTIVAFPVEDDRKDRPSAALDKHHVRGRYVSVEELRKLENGEVEWRCASMSTAGGSIPTRLAESHMASSLANNVPPFLAWFDKQLAKSPSTPTPKPPSHPSRTDSSASHSTNRISMEGLRRSLSFKSRKDLEGRESPRESAPVEVGATA